jgi:hypothetical protein
MMEEYCANIIQMSSQGEQASLGIVVPNFDSVIISSRYEHRLCLMKVYTSNRAIMFLETINKSSHTVVPKLDGRGVERNQDPWSFRVECNSLCAGGLGLKLLKVRYQLSTKKSLENVTLVNIFGDDILAIAPG